MRQIILLLTFLLVSSGLTFAQTTVSGKVTSSSGETFPGVNIVITGTTTGTVSDINGEFSLPVPDIQNGQLSISFIGFKTQIVDLSGNTTINVVLQESFQDLDEVIVVGYGEMRKSDLTGSISSISVKNANERGVPSVDQLLQGRAAGVHVKTNSGVPGGAVQINIRGVGSMSASNQPLYVVDGMILDAGGDESGDASTLAMTASNPIAFLSPEDIENIEILKDASATAIYGSRGANGVVLVTTKKGNKGEGEISYSNSFSFSEVEKYIDVMDGDQWKSYRNEMNEIAWELDGTPEEDRNYTYPDSVQILPVNWQEDTYQKAFSQKHRLSFSKADDESALFLSAGYLDSEGIISSTGFKKMDIRVNSRKKITDRLDVTTNFNISRLENDMTVGTEVLGGNRSMVGSIVFSAPVLNGAVDEFGDFDPDEFYNSPTAWLNDHSDKSKEYTVVSKISLDYEISKTLSATARMGMDYKNKNRLRYLGRGIDRGFKEGGIGEKYDTQNFHWVSDFLLNYKNKFGAHRVAATLGATADQKLLERSKLRSTFFIDDFLGAEAMHAGANQKIEYTDQFNVKYMSVLFRGNYSYKNRLSATITGRQDFSNKLGKGQKGAFFPALATAYRLSEESFIKDLKVFSNLKIRAGWGQVGNSSNPSFATVNSMRFSTVVGEDGLPKTILAPGQKGNPDLTWETSEQTNIGLDLGMFDNRFSLTVDAYNKETKDQLQEVQLSPEYGYSSMWYNLGTVSNKGIEASINAVLYQDKDFHVSIGGNIAFNRNKIVEMGGNSYLGENLGQNSEIKDPVNMFREGEAVGVFWGFETDGIIQTPEEAIAEDAPLFYGNAMAEGNTRFIDQNRDTLINDLDKTIIGDPNPDFVYGFNGEFGYKGLSLNFLFTGVQGRDVFNGNFGRLRNFHLSGTNKLAEAYTDAWRPGAPSDVYPRLDYEQAAFSSIYTDQWVEDASFLRLSNVTVSYLWKPGTKLIKNVKFFVTGNNLLTFTKYKGYDPEVDSYPTNPKKIGIDLNSFPSIRSIMFGVNVTL
ncbi:MAG: TonB-dependent receptor [Bacteroidetes bacterium]|nr:TonB-dependent receptor [Bacteroidota bacterium]